MKKTQMKRAGIGSMKSKDLMKPFGFCCDTNHQDPDTQYDMRVPPFVTSLTNIPPNKDGGPDLKFRIQDIIGRPTYPTLRSGTQKVKKSAHLGRCKRCRGPLRWYIEEEIALAREIVASERASEYNSKKRAEALLRKNKHSRGKKKERKRLSKEAIPKKKEKEDEAENDDSDRDEEKNLLDH